MVGYVALGSNLGVRESHLQAGLDGLEGSGVEPEAVSSVWETEPVDSPDSGWFLNMAARIRTVLGPEGVLEVLLRIERDTGRVRAERNAPRILDLDLLLLGDHRMNGSRLVLPHPRMWERRFVLAPLAELAPDLVNPATGRTVLETYRALGDRPAIRKIGVLAAPLMKPL